MDRYVEIKEMLMREQPSSLLRKSKDLLFACFPEFEMCAGFDQQTAWHQYDVLEHIFHVVDKTPAQLEFRLAALFHDVGKPACFFVGHDGIGHAYGHEIESARIFKRYEEELGLDEERRNHIIWLILRHMDNFPGKKKSLWKKVNKFGWKDTQEWLTFKWADTLAHSSFAREKSETLYDQNRLWLEEIGTELEQTEIEDLTISTKDLRKIGLSLSESEEYLRFVVNKIQKKEWSNYRMKLLENVNLWKEGKE